MKEKPVLFSTAMVKAILSGKKTQTRRVYKSKIDTEQTVDDITFQKNLTMFIPEAAPFQVGQKLWVRETHWLFGEEVKLDYKTKSGKWATTFKPLGRNIYYADTKPKDLLVSTMDGIYGVPGWYKRPSIFMPRWASRITLEVTQVRIQRLQDISEEDAIAEGIEKSDWEYSCTPYKNYLPPFHPNDGFAYAPASYKSLWDSINGKKHPWSSNPWVWAYSFKEVH